MGLHGRPFAVEFVVRKFARFHVGALEALGHGRSRPGGGLLGGAKEKPMGEHLGQERSAIDRDVEVFCRQ